MSAARLQDCLAATDAAGFAQRLGAALRALPAGTLPLQTGCTQGGLVDDHAIATMVLGVEHTRERVVARVGVFFSELVGGCNCNDDPLAVNAYCLLRVSIDTLTGVAQFEPAAD